MQAVEVLRPLLYDPAAQVRATAAWALAGGIYTVTYTVTPTDLDQQNIQLLQQSATGENDVLVRSIASAGLQVIATRPEVASSWRREFEPQWADDSVVPQANQ